MEWLLTAEVVDIFCFVDW